MAADPPRGVVPSAAAGGQRLAQVPRGVQCFFGDEARRRRALESQVVSVFEGWDYEEIIPPLYDYAEVFSDPDLQPRTLSFMGRDGGVLALRSDFTSLLAKIAAGRLSDRPAPIRLYYSGEVLRDEPLRTGTQSELYQMGLEHLGGDPRAADAEVVAVAAECLERLGVEGWVVAVGHVGVLGGLAAEAGLAQGALEPLRERVDAKDAAGVRALAEQAGASPECVAALGALIEQTGPPGVLPRLAAALAFCGPARDALAELTGLVSSLVEAGLGDRVVIDLAEVRGFGYYTGVVLRAYAPGAGADVGRGGRYDSLLSRFGRPMPAVGFMFGLDRLAALLDGRRPAASGAPPEAEVVTAAALPDALREARARRARGARVRLEVPEP
jgi:ATP phosphoribosyltransferase regulatory subunit